MIKSEGIKITQHPLIICLIVLILFFAIANPMLAFYSDMVSYFSVGTDISEFIVGTTSSIFLVGEGTYTSTPDPSPGNTAGSTILKVLSGLILAGIVIATAITSKNIVITGVVMIVGVVLLAMLTAILQIF